MQIVSYNRIGLNYQIHMIRTKKDFKTIMWRHLASAKSSIVIIAFIIKNLYFKEPHQKMAADVTGESFFKIKLLFVFQFAS